MLLSRDDYLKLAARALADHILPQLAGTPAQSLGSVVEGALTELRKRDAMLPGLRESLAPSARDLLERLAALAPQGIDPAELAAMRHDLSMPPFDAALWQDLLAVLDRGARALLGPDGAEGAASLWLRDAAEWELAYYQGFADAPAPDPGEGTKDFQPLTREKLEAHLQARLTDRANLRVTDFIPIAGGFSNETYFFTLQSDGHQPEELVVRKNAPWPFFTHWAHDAAEEYQILSIVADAGLPVPRPLWLFKDMPDVDGTYYVMTKGKGRMVGTLAGASEALPEKLLFSLAEFLAGLHAIPAEKFATYLEKGKLPTQPGDRVSDAVRRNVESMRAVWEKGPRLPSPGEAFTIDWLLRNVPANANPPSVVHTDCFVHNFLVQDDEIETVVDWEASHLGDPAEDLAYVKDQVSQHMDWGRFVAHYRASGGPEIDEASLDYYKCLLNFRNYFGSNIGAARIPQGYNDIRMIPLGSQFITIFMKATIEATRSTAGKDSK